MMTGVPQLESTKELMKQGIVDHVVKPVDKEKLVKTVETAMRQRELSRVTTLAENWAPRSPHDGRVRDT